MIFNKGDEGKNRQDDDNWCEIAISCHLHENRKSWLNNGLKWF